MEESTDSENERTKMKKTGRVISVYDGRKWPVVHCGNVIVSPDEKVSDVKSNIVSGNISKDKRKKSSKYALAIASSFGHVHAFLQDEEYVLNKVDATTTEDKCLMLIKKPKSSSKKMFKSQSWANLSLSDSHLYNQPNYNTEGRKHKYRMRRKPSDLQTVPSESMMNLTDYGLRVDSYIPQQRDCKVRDSRNSQNRFSGVTSPQSCHSEDLTYRNGHLNGNQTSEINNNKLSKQNGSRMYSSHMDIYRTAPTVSLINENRENCVLRSDEMYSEKPVNKGSSNLNNEDSVSRAHSVGDLSTGLTLSVVGQRKADSIQCLSGMNQSFKPVNEEKAQRPLGKSFSVSENKRKETARKCAENKKDLQNTLRDLLSNISETKEKENDKNKNMDLAKPDTSTPMKPKRALPSVPQGQANDRKKHYTEIVKMRMSQHSRTGQSSSSGTSSSVRTVLDTPLDKEVSELLGNDRESCPGMIENIQSKENNGNSYHHKHHSYHHDSLNVSIPSSVRSCDSGQATITSLSSTVDSGYLTNDAENDMYSSTSYTKSLQKSAKNFYSKKVPAPHTHSLHTESAKSLEKSHMESTKNLQNLHMESAKGLQNSHMESAKNLQNLQLENVKKLQHNNQNMCRNNNVDDHRAYMGDFSGTATFPRPGHSLTKENSYVAKENYIESIANSVIQENQNSNLKVCDMPVKYSSMKQLPTSDLSPGAGQRLSRSQTQNGSSKIDHDDRKITNKNEIVNVQTKVIKNVDTLSQGQCEGQISMADSHYNTLPGNWKFQSNQNQDESVKRLPSLHQLSQTYQFIPVTIAIGMEFNILDHLQICENCVMLQNSKKAQKRESTAMSPPQGKYARLGGPGSAFKPVKVSDTSLYSVISVKEVSGTLHNRTLQKGDVLIEVNQRMVIGETLKSVKSMISSSTGELLLTIARSADTVTSCTQTANENSGQSSTSTNNNNDVKPQALTNVNLVDSQVEHLKKQIAKLTVELKRKNKAIRELNSLLPWRPNDDQSEINGNNEITLNGLSEDEFIV